MTRQEFRRALGPLVNGNKDTVRALESVVAEHRAKRGMREAFDVPTQDYVRRRAAAARLHSALEALEVALCDAPEDLLEALAGAAPHLHSASLKCWRQDLFELRETTRELQAIQRGRRGAPVNLQRRSLEHQTYRAADRGGVRLTKARDGVFAKILTLVYDAAGEPCPEDLFPVLRRVLPAGVERRSQVSKSSRSTKN